MFTQAAQRISQKQDIYQLSRLETGRDYYKYSPFFALLMIPLSKLHQHLAVPIWYLSIFIFFMAAIFFTKEILISHNRKRILSRAFFFSAILMSLRFLLSVLQRVQSDCLVLFLISLFILALFYKRQFLAGIPLACAAMVKLTPLIFLPYLLLRKKFKTVFACSLFLLFFLLLPAFYLGQSKNWELLKNWFWVHRQNPPEYILWYKNQSLFSALSRFLTADSRIAILNLPPVSVFIIFIVLSAILFSLIFIFSKKTQSSPSGISYLTEISLVIICMILFSPLGWKHTFVHLIIPHLVLLYYLFYINPADKTVRVLLISSFCINTVLNPELTKPIAQLIQEYANITLGTLILFAALLRVATKLHLYPECVQKGGARFDHANNSAHI